MVIKLKIDWDSQVTDVGGQQFKKGHQLLWPITESPRVPSTSRECSKHFWVTDWRGSFIAGSHRGPERLVTSDLCFAEWKNPSLLCDLLVIGLGKTGKWRSRVACWGSRSVGNDRGGLCVYMCLYVNVHENIVIEAPQHCEKTWHLEVLCSPT